MEARAVEGVKNCYLNYQLYSQSTQEKTEDKIIHRKTVYVFGILKVAAFQRCLCLNSTFNHDGAMPLWNKKSYLVQNLNPHSVQRFIHTSWWDEDKDKRDRGWSSSCQKSNNIEHCGSYAQMSRERVRQWNSVVRDLNRGAPSRCKCFGGTET